MENGERGFAEWAMEQIRHWLDEKEKIQRFYQIKSSELNDLTG